MKSSNFEKIENKLNIVFQDDYIVVINKNSGLLSHCNKNDNKSSVVKLLRKDNVKLFSAEDPLKDGIVHRLDKDTSGLMVLAKNLKSYKNLVRQFQNRDVLKIYKAYCWSIPLPLAGVINKPISAFLNRKKVRTKNIGKEAITEYKVIKNFNNYFSEVECKILTGRTHQIRVHMQSIKCPLVGDQLYSRDRNISKSFSKRLQKVLANFKRQALHAEILSFNHPINKKLETFNVNQPFDMLNLKNVLVDEFDSVC